MSSTTIQKATVTGNSQLSSTRPNKPNTRSTSPKGRSKYAQKARSSAKKKPAVKSSGPVFLYTSVCCSAPAKKKPCVAVNKKDALTQTLGKFRCNACGKRAKVTVSKYKAPEAPAPVIEMTLV